MGQAIAAVLSQHGLRTLAALDDRSDRTRQLAAEVQIQDVGSLKNLVIEADVVLSVLVPAAATEAAEQIAPVIGKSGKPLLYVDANAIAPHRVLRIGQIIQAAGGQFVDAAIIGPRWIGEMEEIADTFKELGLTEHIFQGAADVYRLVKETSLGKETPEERDRNRSLHQVITTLSDEGQ